MEGSIKITQVTAKKVKAPLSKPFTISLGTITASDIVFLRLDTDCGLVGYGEGVGIGFVTGETSDTILGAIKLFEPLLVGRSPFAIEQIHSDMDKKMVGNGSAKAAVDIALYDLMSKAAGLPLYRFLGGVSGSVETDMTIGINTPEVMAAEAAKRAAEGFREIKVKAGTDPATDMLAIRFIREAAPGVHLKVDANQGWTVAEALRVIREYEKYGVESVEQPVPYWDHAGLKEVRTRSNIPIMADESCFTPKDAFKLASSGAADVLNIKLMKCGGLYRANQICAIAEAAGIRCMLGCMLESKLSIAAAAAFVAARPNVIYADLDSFHEFDDTGIINESFAYTTPVITLGEKPGIGVSPHDDCTAPCN